MVIINSFQHPESPLKIEQANVSVVLDHKQLGNGTLFVSERTLAWQKSDDNVGFSLEYFNVTLHAISKDANVHEKECIYVLTDPHIYMPGENVPDPEDSDEESEPQVSELLFIPEETQIVASIYEALKQCQELNPDPVDVDGTDDEDNLYADAEDDEMNIEEAEEAMGDAAVANLAQRLQNNSVGGQHFPSQNGNNDEEQFEDAD